MKVASRELLGLMAIGKVTSVYICVCMSVGSFDMW